MRNLKFIAAIGLFSIVQVGCFHRFYKTNTEVQVDKEKIEKLVAQKKYFILHTTDSVVALVDPVAAEEDLKGSTQILPKEYQKDISPKTDNPNRLSKKTGAVTLSQVHLYTNEKLGMVSDSGAISYSKIARMDVYGFDKSATSGSTIFSIIGITLVLGLILLIGVIIADGAYFP